MEAAAAAASAADAMKDEDARGHKRKEPEAVAMPEGYLFEAVKLNEKATSVWGLTKLRKCNKGPGGLPQAWCTVCGIWVSGHNGGHLLRHLQSHGVLKDKKKKGQFLFLEVFLSTC